MHIDVILIEQRNNLPPLTDLQAAVDFTAALNNGGEHFIAAFFHPLYFSFHKWHAKKEIGVKKKQFLGQKHQK